MGEEIILKRLDSATCPITDKTCKHYNWINSFVWLCNNNNNKDKDVLCRAKKNERKTSGNLQVSFTMLGDGSAEVSARSFEHDNKMETTIFLSRNMLLDIYDDISRFYASSICQASIRDRKWKRSPIQEETKNDL